MEETQTDREHQGSTAGMIKESGRVEAFSDGVFGIALTLLVLGLVLPRLGEEAESGALLKALLHMWPALLAYALSFFTILIMWVNHHRLFEMLGRIDSPFMYFNGLLLFFVVLTPFTTDLVAEYLMCPAAPVGAVVYAGNFVLISIAYNLIWRRMSKNRRLLKSDVSAEQVKAIDRAFCLGPTGYLLASVVSVFSALAGVCIVTALAVYYLIHDGGSAKSAPRKNQV